MNKIELSVVIPAYNESGRIKETLQSLKYFFRAQGDDTYEIIVVDDGSTDDTVAVVKTFAQEFPSLRILENGINRGKGYAVNSGMTNALGKYRLFMDADNSVDISHIESFMPYLAEGYEVVIGSIQLDRSVVHERAGVHRRAMGHVAKLLIQFFSVPEIKDTQRGFKLFTREATMLIFPQQTIWRFGFDVEVLVIAWVNGLRIKELPVVWNNPSGSKVTLWSYVQTLRELAYIARNRLAGKYASPEAILSEKNDSNSRKP